MSNIKLLFEDTNVLYFSPHFDDLAFSNGGFILKKFPYKKFTLINVFTNSLYAPQIKDTHRHDISRIRESEDQAYCKRHQIQFINLGYDDSSCRGYDDVTEFNTDPFRDNLMDSVKVSITKLLKGINFDIIFYPLAIGNQVDHLMVFSIIDQLNIKSKIRLIYEDLPYCAKVDLPILENIVTERIGCPRPYKIDMSGEIELKIMDMKIYNSQTRKGDIEAIHFHAARIASNNKRYEERIWYLI